MPVRSGGGRLVGCGGIVVVAVAVAVVEWLVANVPKAGYSGWCCVNLVVAGRRSSGRRVIASYVSKLGSWSRRLFEPVSAKFHV